MTRAPLRRGPFRLCSWTHCLDELHIVFCSWCTRLRCEILGQTNCEGCLTSLAEQAIPTGEDERCFQLCNSCANRLHARALRPLEWYRLAALHGPLSYLLHDDFYDQDGTAWQNEIPVIHSALFPAPKLSAVSYDLAALLDYALTRWHLDDETAEVLGNFPTDQILDALSELLESRPTYWVECRSYEIAGTVLRGAATTWLNARWDRGTQKDFLSTFLRAVAKSNPTVDTVRRAIQAIDDAGKPDLSVAALALAGFRSPLVLDWIEQRVKSPVSDRWGWVAGCSGFSWEVAERWLDSGRPLSLVALDTLVNCLCPAAGNKPPGFVAELANAPPAPDLLARIAAYGETDPVPRVSAIIRRLSNHFDLPLKP